jgi:hypothetical protein
MRRLLLGGAMVFAVGLTAAAAQNPTTPPPPRNPASLDPAYTRTQARFVTVEGCVMREADVSGREPNVAERAGIDEDYILTRTKMIKGAAPPPAAEARPADTPTGTSGTGTMYEIKGIDDEQLKQHVGHRVQIEGTFENIERAQTSPDEKTPADHLAEIRGTSIRQVAGDCPAK